MENVGKNKGQIFMLWQICKNWNKNFGRKQAKLATRMALMGDIRRTNWSKLLWRKQEENGLEARGACFDFVQRRALTTNFYNTDLFYEIKRQ